MFKRVLTSKYALAVPSALTAVALTAGHAGAAASAPTALDLTDNIGAVQTAAQTGQTPLLYVAGVGVLTMVGIKYLKRAKRAA